MKTKKLICIVTISLFLFIGCASNTQRGAGIGAGAGTIASVIAGKDGTTAALLIMGGALLGGLIGNTIDEQAKSASLQPENRNKTIMVVEEEPNKASTNCSKVTTKKWKNGNLISEVTEENCRGERKSNIYE